jgi:fumarylpyruvate hydrolase
MTYIIPAPPVPSLPVVGSDQRFPIRRVFCIGRNYAEHAREMGATVDKASPMFFCKPADAVVADGKDLPYPSATLDLHHEVEMVVALGAGGSDIAVADAGALVWGYAVGLDLTRRDLQAQAKAKGLPWDVAKGFDRSAPAGTLVPAAEAGDVFAQRLWLEVNGALRQAALLSAMVWSVADILHELSLRFELRAGDVIFMGTPAGVAALVPGDAWRAGIDGVVELEGRILAG